MGCKDLNNGKEARQSAGQLNMVPDPGMEEHLASVQRPSGWVGLDRTWPLGSEKKQSPTVHINIRAQL